MARYKFCSTPLGRLRVRVAEQFWSRAVGLLAGKPLEETEGLLISRCSSIHTIGMRYPIDVVFMDRRGRVLRVCAAVRAARMRFARGAWAVLELRAGVATEHGLQPGVRLEDLAAEPCV